MKYSKTPRNKRQNYVYEFADGTRAVIPASAEMEQWIRTLHLLDDAEVYNNIKNNKVSTEKSVDDTEGGSDTNWTLSIDGLMTNNSDDSIYALQIADARNEVDPIAELVSEKVLELSEKDQELYRLYFIEGNSQQEIAAMKGVAQQTLNRKILRLQKRLMKLCNDL